MYYVEWENKGFPLEPININGKVIVYVHIPKAAGNSSILPIKNSVDSAYSVQWNDLQNSWNNFLLEQKKTKKYDLVSGHIRDIHLTQLKESNINAYYITFLRHPYKRIKSLYAYNSMDSTPGSNKFKKTYKNFEDYALNGVMPNSMSRQLFSGALSSWEAIEKLKSRYHFIGLSDHYELSMTALSKLLNIDIDFNIVKNPSNYYHNDQFYLSSESYKELQLKHSIDMDMYKNIETSSINLFKVLFKIKTNDSY